MVGGRGSLHVQASKGIHLVVPRDRIRSEAGFIVRTEKSVLFVIPWGRHWIIGTTDTPWDLDKAHPAASRADIDYILGHVNAILREPLDHEDVEGVYAGLRPLLAGESEPTSRISREHTVVTPVPGLVMIAGGKLTTYRVMAEDAVDAAGALAQDDRRPRSATRSPTGCRCSAPTASRPAPTSASSSPAAPACTSPAIDHLLGRYGGAVDDLLALIDASARSSARRSPAPRTTWRPRSSTPSPTRAPATSTTCSPGVPAISIETFDRGVSAAPPRARLMAAELGWDDARTADEVDHYLRRVEAERQSQLALTDQEADEARVRRRRSSDRGGESGARHLNSVPTRCRSSNVP